jgi:hypothetical protein
MNTKDNKKIPVIMLVGEGHSGSTLLDLVMDSHSQILGVGEISHYSRSLNHKGLCSCKKELSRCDFWNKVFKGIDYKYLHLFFRNKKDFILNRKEFYYYSNGNKKLDTKKYLEETGKLYKNALEVSGKKIIFDSSKITDRVELIAQSDIFDVLIVHLVRDGRGVAYSNVKLGRNAIFFMKKWMMVNLKTELVKFRNKNICHCFILYEDFVENPQTIIKHILQKIDLDFELNMLNFRSGDHHQIGGNFNLRILKKNQDIILDQSWKDGLTVMDKIIFSILFSWMNIFYKLKRKEYDI